MLGLRLLAGTALRHQLLVARLRKRLRIAPLNRTTLSVCSAVCEGARVLKVAPAATGALSVKVADGMHIILPLYIHADERFVE